MPLLPGRGMKPTNSIFGQYGFHCAPVTNTHQIPLNVLKKLAGFRPRFKVLGCRWRRLSYFFHVFIQHVRHLCRIILQNSARVPETPCFHKGFNLSTRPRVLGVTSLPIFPSQYHEGLPTRAPGNGGNPCKQVAHLLTTGGLNGAVFRLASRIE